MGIPAAVEDYLQSLPADRAAALRTIRDAISEAMPEGYEEGIQYGMIGWYVPHSRYPNGYHCDPKQPLPFCGLGSQKNHMAVYLFCIYIAPGGEEAFREAWIKTGKKLDMGKSCLRFKKAEDVAIDVLQDAIRAASLDSFLEMYEASIPPSKRKQKA